MTHTYRLAALDGDLTEITTEASAYAEAQRTGAYVETITDEEALEYLTGLALEAGVDTVTELDIAGETMLALTVLGTRDGAEHTFAAIDRAGMVHLFGDYADAIEHAGAGEHAIALRGLTAAALGSAIELVR